MNNRADISAQADRQQVGGTRALLQAHTAFLCDVLPLGRRTRIMDIGANPTNRPPYADLAENDAAEVHGFEPGEKPFARLDAQKGDSEVYYPFAVGAGGDGTFHNCRNETFSSLFAPDVGQIKALGHWEKALTVVGTTSVTTLRLDDVDDMVRPDMLKMDTQGAELAILEGGTKTLADTVVVMPELRFFRLYEGEPMLGRVDQQLRDMGFMFHKLLPATSLRLMSSRIERLRPGPTRNQMIDADAIYIRDIAKPDAMTDQQIAHLALLADSVFGSFDLVLRCLDLLTERGEYSAELIDTYIDKLPDKFRVAED
ncbi:FkbM family methyltransferase [Marimonas sp. MJW-29]|uniref:FkbM family methyltransferase n=1 Tax=Sulfitobacter sediminis TaxID=3234186 RepID=A0ABV3RSF2_9RHOB